MHRLGVDPSSLKVVQRTAVRCISHKQMGLENCGDNIAKVSEKCAAQVVFASTAVIGGGGGGGGELRVSRHTHIR